MTKKQIKLAIMNGKEQQVYEQLVITMIRSKYTQNAIEYIKQCK